MFKHLLITWVFVLTLGGAAQAQVPLEAGDVFTYQFDSLPAAAPFPIPVDRPVGGFSIEVSGFSAAEDVMLVEMFENSTDETLITSFVTEAVTDGTAITSAWADHQGVLRFTMLSGSVTLEQLTVFYAVPFDETSRLANLMTVVPVRAADRVEQLVPCEGPVTGGAWRNHGDYVGAVAGVLRELLSGGSVTEEEARDILRWAAQSPCGRR